MAEWPLKHDGPCACRFVRREDFAEIEQLEWCGLHRMQRDKMEEAKTGLRRYETVRKLNAQQFAELYKKNIESGVPFDQLVDEITGA